MKRKLIFIIIISIITLLFSQNVFSLSEGGLIYREYGDGLEVCGYGDTLSGAVTVPSAVDSLPVISVSDYAFLDCSGLTAITLPASVKTVGKRAFAFCNNLSSVTLEGAVTAGEGAFAECVKLKSVFLSESLRSVGAYAFSGCRSLTDISIPDGTLYMENNVFRGCASLQNVFLPESLSFLGDCLFFGCRGLKSIYYKGSPEKWNRLSEKNREFLSDVRVITGFDGVMPGDCNGDTEINNKDIVTLFRYVSGGISVPDTSACDFNLDGAIDNKDVVALFRYVSEK